MINELDLQAFLFERDAKRIDLINFVPTIDPSYRVSICRNHSFELIENTIKPYLEYGGLGVEFSYSSYDDSLSFLELDLSVDMVILWLDLSAYKMQDLKGFIEARVKHLRETFNGNILFVPCGGDTSFNVESLQVVHYKLSGLEERLGEKFFDLRLEPFSGTKLSSDANLEISRDLGLNYLPALLRPNLKGVVVDLDNSLYQGVLGEDGIDGVVLSKSHQLLQEQLKELSQQGFFLCIASKNDERDVTRLFEERSDFPLQIDDFVKVYANWESKADSISSIAESLNISTDSLLFIDDNVGELVSVLEVHPAINVIWAKDDASITHDILSNYPGLLKLSSKREDSLRKGDTRANKERLEIQSSLSQERYLQDLKIELLYEVDNLAHVARVTELSNKTNQFIFSYQRYSYQQVEMLMKSDESTVVTISLADRLSESGIIGVIVLKKQGGSNPLEDYGLLEECFVSCRALGRGIDQAIVLGGLSVALKSLSVNKLKVDFTKGERNFPAEKFSKKYFDTFRASPGDFEYQIPTNLIAVTIK